MHNCFCRYNRSNRWKPVQGLFPVVATTDLAYEAAEATSFMDTLVNIFPSNFVSPMVEANMLQVIVMAIILGFAIILVGEKTSAL